VPHHVVQGLHYDAVDGDLDGGGQGRQRIRSLDRHPGAAIVLMVGVHPKRRQKAKGVECGRPEPVDEAAHV
jgi:hypothetical protein